MSSFCKRYPQFWCGLWWVEAYLVTLLTYEGALWRYFYDAPWHSYLVMLIAYAAMMMALSSIHNHQPGVE